MRAFIGLFVSVWTAHLARESWPFIRSAICVLLVVAKLQIFFVYFCAALLLTDSFEGFGWSDFELGSILFAVNLLSFFLVIYWGFQMYLEEKRRKKKKEASVLKPEWAYNFSKNKYSTTLKSIVNESLSQSELVR